MHILLCGERGAGKSTLIARLTDALGVSAGGFLTKIEAAEADGFAPVYMHPVTAEIRRYEAENRVGYCDTHSQRRYPEVFDELGTALLESTKNAPLIVMDELGVMENDAAAFQTAVLKLLDGDVPVLAAVKSKGTPFLEAVRQHPGVRCFTVNAETRNALFEELLPLLRAEVK